MFMKHKKLLFGITGAVLVLLVMWLVLTKAKTENTSNTGGVPVQTPGATISEGSTTLPYPTIPDYSKPEGVEWKTTVVLPETIQGLQLKLKPEVQYLPTILAKIGFASLQPDKNDGRLLLYIKNETNESFYINKTDSSINFSRDLYQHPLPTTTTQLSTAVLQQNFIDFCSLMFPASDGFKIQIDQTSYQKISGEGFVSATTNNADDLLFSAHLIYHGNSIVTTTGEPIQFRYSLDGTLLSFVFPIPITVTPITITSQLKSKQEIFQSPPTAYTLVEIDGGTALEQTSTMEVLKNVLITNANFGYYLKEGVLVPVIITEGNAMMSIGPVTVKMILPIEKQ